LGRASAQILGTFGTDNRAQAIGELTDAQIKTEGRISHAALAAELLFVPGLP